MFAILVVLTLSFFAGVRDFTVGQDIFTYGNNVFLSAVSSGNLTQLSNSTYGSGIEWGYLIINFLVSRITSDPHIFYFTLGLLAYTITYLGIIQYRKHVSVTFSLFVFLILYYGPSLALLRQFTAMAVVFLALGLFINSYKKTSIILLVIASFLHSSGFIGFPMLAFYLVITKVKNRLRFILISSVVLLLLILFFSNTIINQLLSSGFLSSKYSMYMTESYIVGTSSTISITNLYRLVFFVPYFFLNKNDKTSTITSTLLAFMLFDFSFLFIKGTSGQAVSRIGLYFGLFRIIAYSYPLGKIALSKYRNFILFVWSFVLLGYFVMYTPTQVQGTYGYYPYTSQIIGIN